MTDNRRQSGGNLTIAAPAGPAKLRETLGFEGTIRCILTTGVLRVSAAMLAVPVTALTRNSSSRVRLLLVRGRLFGCGEDTLGAALVRRPVRNCGLSHASMGSASLPTPGSQIGGRQSLP